MDIVERLREKIKSLEWLKKMGGSDKNVVAIMNDAAAEIERLRSCEAYNAKSVAWANVEIERLREALARIEEIGEHLVWPVATMRDTAMKALQGKELD